MGKESVIIGGTSFSKELFDDLILRYKESFSRSSLSVERAFEILEDFEAEKNSLCDDLSYEYYTLLESKERKAIDRDLRKYVVICGYRTGILRGEPELTDQKKIDSAYEDNFKFMSDDLKRIVVFNEEGIYQCRPTQRKVEQLFRITYEYRQAEENATNMKKDHLDAFDYAMKLSKIGIPEIIRINSIVNNSRPEKEEGFKNTNNMIRGANFNVSDKCSVPVEMQKLLADYNNDFDLEILDYNDPKISTHERRARILKIFQKEALFHIRFEKIHPFADGNGRTGRIIMIKHLLDYGLAPVLITGVMSEQYKRYIEKNDYQGLAEMMFASSSQELSDWISLKKTGFRRILVDPSNKKLAKDKSKNKQYKLFLF